MIISVQYLRACAALMVVAFHAAEHQSRLGGVTAGLPFAAGAAGVDIFFVISGFVIARSAAAPGVTLLAFLRRRLTRIAPLYWLLTLLVANAAILRPDLLSSTLYDSGHLLASLAFLPAMHPVLDETLPVLIPGWTLNYEMAFYVLVAVSLALPHRVRLPAILGILITAVALREIIPYRPLTAFYTMPLILEFGAGILLAKASSIQFPVPRWLTLGTFFAGWIALLAMADSGLWRSVAAGLPATLIVSGAVFAERSAPVPRRAFPLLVGDASYAIYLSHVLTLPILAALWSSAGPESLATPVLFIAIALISATLVGILVHRLIEQPMLELLQSRSTSLNSEQVLPAPLLARA